MASGTEISLFTLENGSFQNQGGVAVPAQGWDNFQTITGPNTINLASGTQRIRVEATGSADWQWNLGSFALTFVESTDPVDPVDPPATGESFTVEMETFDYTGSDDPRANGMVVGERGYPNDKHTVVDSNQTTDWVEYTVNVPTAGDYRVEMLASGTVSHATAILFIDGVHINETPIHTGNQAEFALFELSPSVFMSAGLHAVRVQSGSTTGTYSWMWFGDYLRFTPTANNGGGEPDGDTDNDGVVDSVDQCPNTPAGVVVDTNGCAINTNPDSDGDGINDSADQCPNTASGSSVNGNGCADSQLDSDQDGINNSVDQCPNTPAGTTVDNVGCAVSTNPGGDIIVELEDFITTGARNKIGGDSVIGFGASSTGVNWVTNGDYGDYGDYDVTFAEPGTYRAFITISAASAGSYGARIMLEDWPVAWGYMASTGSWDVSQEFGLDGGHFAVAQAGTYRIRVQAYGGSDWQWSGDKVRFAKIGSATTAPHSPPL